MYNNWSLISKLSKYYKKFHIIIIILNIILNHDKNDEYLNRPLYQFFIWHILVVIFKKSLYWHKCQVFPYLSPPFFLYKRIFLCLFTNNKTMIFGELRNFIKMFIDSFKYQRVNNSITVWFNEKFQTTVNTIRQKTIIFKHRFIIIIIIFFDTKTMWYEYNNTMLYRVILL